jgi:hypothetical protein
MAGNIPGTNGTVLPGVFTDVETQSVGASIPGGIRVAAIIGQGSTSETIVSAALGGGADGLDPTYTTTNGADGRHFALSQAPIISNRTTLFRNGIPLVGLEALIDNNTFSNSYDYRIDITTGHIELQQAHLVDQGGSFYIASTTNVGIGVINGLTLTDVNAPSETWSIKCVSVQRTPLNQPIANTANFVAVGTVSGNLLDANGNPVIWIANNTTNTNGILKFAIQETASTPFREGDFFTIKVSSGVLNRNDTLTASYIPVANLNDPLFLATMDDISKRHGFASTDNNLTLGCQLAFANSTPGIMTVQAAPPIPRRTSYVLTTNMQALSTNPNDFIFPLPVGVVPDFNSNIHFFVKNNTTQVEKQLLPNKFTFYTLDTAGQPTTNSFIFDNALAPAGNSFAYSVNQAAEALVTGMDGYITENIALGHRSAIFTSSIVFDSSFVGKTLAVIDANNVANKGSFTIDAVSNGALYVHTNLFGDFTNETGETFELIDPTTGLVVAGSAGTDGTLVTAGAGTEQATLHSTAINFGSFSGLLGLKVQIAGSNFNNGYYDITSYNSGTNTLTIQKRFVTESNLRYEVIDSSTMGQFIVVNHNIVPNGYQLRVTIVDARDAAFFDAGWLNALASLEPVECDIIVPLPNQTISVIFQNAFSHVRTMSNIQNRKERVLFIGAINGLQPDNLTGAVPAAVEDIGVLEGIQGETIADILAGNTEDLTNYSVPDAFGDVAQAFRVVYFYPDQIVVQAGTDNVLIDGFYIAAAAAGYFSGQNNIAMPLTQKVLAGFTILRNKQFSPLVLSQLAAAGVTTLQPVTGGGLVVWGITTTQSGFVEEQEISIVFIRDRLAKNLRAGFQAFIGLPEDDSTQSKLSARATAILTGAISQGLITAFKDLLVQRDTVDPTQWDISARVQPVYPVNFIFIKISIGLL